MGHWQILPPPYLESRQSRYLRMSPTEYILPPRIWNQGKALTSGTSPATLFCPPPVFGIKAKPLSAAVRKWGESAGLKNAVFFQVHFLKPIIFKSVLQFSFERVTASRRVRVTRRPECHVTRRLKLVSSPSTRVFRGVDRALQDVLPIREFKQCDRRRFRRKSPPAISNRRISYTSPRTAANKAAPRPAAQQPLDSAPPLQVGNQGKETKARPLPDAPE